MPHLRLLQKLLLTCAVLLVVSSFAPQWVFHCNREGVGGLIATVDAMQPVLGIDIGSEYIKVGIARPRHPIDIVLNEQTKRKTPAVVAFRDGTERYLGESAKALVRLVPTLCCCCCYNY